MPGFRLVLEYDGREFAGWQVQAGGRRTVQGVLTEALGRVSGERVRVIGASRTDAGVHAEGQVAGFRLARAFAPARLAAALNGVLPPDVAVRECEEASAEFHPRYDARAKLYRYAIWNGESRSPLRAQRFHRVPSALDLAAMRAGARLLLGRHDFAAFQTAGSAVRSTERTLARLDVEGEARGEILLWVEGDAFLRHMVRILAGTLIEAGLGRRRPDEIPSVLASRDRRRAGRTAPAHGLTLVRVCFGRADG